VKLSRFTPDGVVSIRIGETLEARGHRQARVSHQLVVERGLSGAGLLD
jgi:hypothetical protein